MWQIVYADRPSLALVSLGDQAADSVNVLMGRLRVAGEPLKQRKELQENGPLGIRREKTVFAEPTC